MGRKNRRDRTAGDAQDQTHRGLVFLIGISLFFTEVLYLPGAYSPFRLPKLAFAICALALLGGANTVYRVVKGRFSVPGGPLVVALIALPVLQLVSAVWAPTPDLALHQAVATAVWVGAAIWFSGFDQEARRSLLNWAVGGAVVSAGVLLLQLGGVDMVAVEGYKAADRLRLTGLAGNPSDLAMSGVLLLPLLLPRVLKRPRKVWPWILPLFLAAAAVLTETLTGMIAVALVALVFLVLLRSRRAWLVAGVLAIGAVVVVAASPVRHRIADEWSRLREGNWYHLLSARDDGWTAAAMMIRHAPVLGVGADQYSREFFPARLSYLEKRDAEGHRGELATHFEWAHNDPLQLVAELGLLGLGWIVAFIVTVLKSGPRSDPALLLMIPAWLPFGLLHYPSHLAVGLVPVVLLLARRLDAGTSPAEPERKPAIQLLTAAAVVVIAATAITFAVRDIRLDQWRGRTESILQTAERAPAAQRRQIAQVIDSEAVARLADHPISAGWTWRIIGRARLLANAYVEAAAAFRRAAALEPHEEAEMGLGLALAGQGRRSEAVHHLTRACRVNPALLAIIQQEDLRSSVRRRLRMTTGRDKPGQ